jgi:hypothetical protein
MTDRKPVIRVESVCKAGMKERKTGKPALRAGADGGMKRPRARTAEEP